jgi:capsid portal protein
VEAIEAAVGEDLYKAHVILTDPPRGSSSQAPTEEIDLGTPDEALPPPESLEQLAALSTFNSTRASCIRAVARNTVGLGYRLEVEPGRERDAHDARDDIVQAIARLEACAARDVRLDAPTFTEQIMAVKTDEEETGWGFLEVSRNRLDGKVDGLFHLPAKRMRRLRDRSGYLLLPPDGDPTNATRYLNFGSKIEYDASGQPTRRLASRFGWARNEVVVFKLYTSESRDYGLPRDANLAHEYLADKLATETNAAFFATGGTLPTVLFVQGEEVRDGRTVNVTVPPDVTQRIHATLTSSPGRKSGSPERVAIIPLPAGVKAQKEVLGSLSDRDIGFVSFRDDVRQRTLSAFNLGPIFIGLMDEGRYSAEVQRALGKEQVFNPEQERYEPRLTNTLLRDLGFPDLRFAFNDLAVEDDAAKRSSAEKMGEAGVITRREFLASHGMPPKPEAAKADTEIEYEGQTYKSAEPEPGQVPYGWNDKLVQLQKPVGGTPPLPEGDGQQGLRPGLGGRDSRDKGQAESVAEGRVEETARRLATRNGAVARRGAQRALERARSLPED